VAVDAGLSAPQRLSRRLSQHLSQHLSINVSSEFTSVGEAARISEEGNEFVQRISGYRMLMARRVACVGELTLGLIPGCARLLKHTHHGAKLGFVLPPSTD